MQAKNLLASDVKMPIEFASVLNFIHGQFPGFLADSNTGNFSNKRFMQNTSVFVDTYLPQKSSRVTS